MRYTIPSAGILLLVLGCNGQSGVCEPLGTADCQSQIRFENVVYTGFGHAERLEMARVGSADQAECHDSGQCAEGSVFPDDPRQVTAWGFGEYSTRDVLGVRVDARTFVVYINESIGAHRTERIIRALTRDS